MKWALLICLLLVTASCGTEENGRGHLQVYLEAETTIRDGLDSGAATEDIQDGWNVRFDSYIAVLGHIQTHFSTDHERERASSEFYAVDLHAVPAQGLGLWLMEDLQVGDWEFYYELGHGAQDTLRHNSVNEEDFARIQEDELSYLIRAEISSSAGQSCPPQGLADPGDAVASGQNSNGDACYDNSPIVFELGVSIPTAYGPCEIDEQPGINITQDSTQSVAITIHGDHIFFNGFPEGSESGILRLAQWLADCDLNVDGTISQEELESIAPSDLAEIDARFQLGGSPITPLETMWDYMQAQLKTQGHYQGEGECPIDGTAADHDH